MKARAHFRTEEDDDRAIWETVAGSGAPFVPTDSGAVSAWFRVANATNAGAGLAFTLPDVLSANAATTSTDARKPTIATSAGNGLPILTCDGTRALTIPIHAGINGSAAWGLGIWLRRTTTVGNPAPFTIRALSGATGAASNKMDCQMTFSGADSFKVFNNQTQSRGAQPASWTINTWVFMLYEFDGTGATEDDRLVISRGGVLQNPLTFQNFDGAPAAMATAAPQPSGGTACLCAQQTSGSNGWVGDIGPNIYILGSKMAGATQGLLTTAARLALTGFEAPT